LQRQVFESPARREITTKIALSDSEHLADKEKFLGPNNAGFCDLHHTQQGRRSHRRALDRVTIQMRKAKREAAMFTQGYLLLAFIFAGASAWKMGSRTWASLNSSSEWSCSMGF
jgi:hypothetical protein